MIDERQILKNLDAVSQKGMGELVAVALALTGRALRDPTDEALDEFMRFCPPKPTSRAQMHAWFISALRDMADYLEKNPPNPS